MYRLKTKLISVLSLLFAATQLQAATLTDIKFAELPGERGEVRLSFDSVPTEPTGYSIEQPARIVLDFSDVENQLSEKKYSMSVGEVNSAMVVEGGGRTRLIINLDSSSPYNSYVDGTDFVVEVGVDAENSAPSYVASPSDPAVAESATVSAPVLSQNNADKRATVGVRDIDFRRGELGEGKIIVKLSDSSIKVDIQEVSKGIEVKFLGAGLPSELQRKLDVVDFATPVTLISSATSSSGVTINVETTGEYDYLAYQADNEYVVSVKPLTRQEIEQKKKEFTYIGDRLSLNFQNIPVRNVLQLIADFTSLNLVASDTVAGNITLRLENVPWDQALDIVLKTKGLDKRQIGNVLMVAPAAEIAERERQEIETQKQLQELAPLRTEYIRIRYANARELFTLFMDAAGGGESSGGDRNSTGTILSERGQAIVDERTNSIILTDTEEKIEEFKRLIDRIDIPVRQVMIEARLVIANSDFRKELGVRVSGTGVAGFDEINADGFVVPDDETMAIAATQQGVLGEGGQPRNSFYPRVGEDAEPFFEDDITLVDLGVFNPAGSVAWNIISNNFLLGLELSALQESGFAEIVSQPKVITGDKQQASILSGTEIPYLEESASGGTTVSFKEAVLKLDVTPQITPDNRVIMDLEINQDSISGIAVTGIPVLDITQLETQVLVADGETIVLGGIFQTETVNGVTKVPLLGDIPFIGKLFRNDFQREDKREMLMFITPRIMSSDFIE